jgi:hypothetical protein
VVGETFGVTLHDWVAAFPTHFDDEYIVAPLRTLAKRVDQQNGAGAGARMVPGDMAAEDVGRALSQRHTAALGGDYRMISRNDGADGGESKSFFDVYFCAA